MLRLFGLDITFLKETEEFDKYLLSVDTYRRGKVLACQNDADRFRSLAGGLLLQYAAEWVKETKEGDCNIKSTDIEWINVKAHRPMELEYGFGKDGKPYWQHLPNYRFNLSHSGDYAVCAVSDSDVGVDIQQIRPVKAGIASRFYTAGEQAVLENRTGEAWEQLFFRIWAVKESYIKLLGSGLRHGLDTFEADLGGKYIIDRADGRKLAVFEEIYIGEGYCGAVSRNINQR